VVVLASGKGGLSSRNTITPPTTSVTTTSSTTTTVPSAATAAIGGDVSVVVGSSTKYGTAQKLEVDNSPVKYTFIQFTVSGTAGHVVTRAILRMHVSSASGANSDSKGRLHVASCGWNEATLAGTTQPQPTIDPAVLDAPAGSVVQGDLVDFDITGAITRGDGTYCLAIDTLSSDGVDYNSRETGAGGTLTITTR
jgi:hypothetical protein